MKLVTAQEMKTLEKAAMEQYAIPGLLLMENAAKAVADVALAVFEELAGERAVVICGKGNNGGDGFGVARWLMSYGVMVKVFLAGASPEKIGGDAAKEMDMFRKAGGKIYRIESDADFDYAEAACCRSDLVIDALLGTGFHGELQGTEFRICGIIQKSGKVVLSVDVPSGVDATKGIAAEGAVKADVTVILGLIKIGLLLYPARDYVGRIVLADIGIPEKLFFECDSSKYLLTADIVRDLLPIRLDNAHKGDAGRVTIAAGSTGFTGAAALCAAGAVKAGAGLVSLLTPVAYREVLSIKLTEVMVHGLPELMPGVVGSNASAEMLRWAEKADVMAIGPGLGVSETTTDAVLDFLQKTKTPVVIDADALTASNGHLDILPAMSADKVLTPHSGEMARLLKKTVEEIDEDRLNIVARYAAKWQAVVVLKGMPTVIGCPDGNVYLNITGCSAMATGGSGDVLTGIIAGFAAQGISLQEAALCGVYLHGLAGKIAADGTVGLAAGEIAAALPAARKALESADHEVKFICNRALEMME